MDVVFEESTNSRLYLDVPFPTTVALSQSKAWPVLRQCKAKREFSSSLTSNHTLIIIYIYYLFIKQLACKCGFVVNRFRHSPDCSDLAGSKPA